jgi:hypothetical protein
MGFREWVPCAYLILDLKISQSLRGGKRSQKFHPTFKIVSYIGQANELLIESFLREGLNP